VGPSITTPSFDNGARTFAVLYNPEIPFYGPQGEIAALELGMRPVMNTTYLSLAQQESLIPSADNCSYVNQFIDELIVAQPDLLMFTFSAYSNIFIDCMHRKRYQPPAFWDIAGANFGGDQIWQLFGSLGETLWARFSTLNDTYLVSNFYYEQVFEQLWGVNTTVSDIGYQATHGAGLSLGILAIERAQSFEPQAIVEQLLKMNVSTAIGPVYLINNSRHYHHPYYCYQAPLSFNDTQKIIYPYTLPGIQPMTYPVSFKQIVPQFYLNFLASLNPPALSSVQWGLIGMAIGIAVLLLAAGVVILVVKLKYHAIFIPKAPDNGEWGA